MFRSIRVRLTLWYLLLVAVTLALFGIAIYFALHEALYSNLDDSLDNRADLATSLATEDGRLKDPTKINIPGDPFEKEHFTRVFDGEGNIVFDNSPADPQVPIDSEAVQLALAEPCADCPNNSTRRHVDVGEGMRVLTRRILDGGVVIGVVEVGLSEGDQRDTLTQLLVILLIAFPLTLVLATAGGVFLAGRALRPVGDITNVARQITAEDLSRRLDMKLPDDELGRLARTFDDMIARLDKDFRRQRQFTADASHELRTPLTAIKGQTEVALQRERTPGEYQEVLRAVNQEVDRMIRLAGSLLSLARADAGQTPIARERVDFAQVAADAVDQMRPSATARGLDLVTDLAPAPLIGDEDLLLQLVLNLLDNAIKYTPSGSVTVSSRTANGTVVLSVADTGPGIAPEHLPHVFDRFYRADPSRSRQAGGAGLGLSISRWIAEGHGGTISVESESGRGSRFTVSLPDTSS